MGRWADLEAQVILAIGDTSSSGARTWLLEAARRLNSEAEFLTATVSIGTTVIGTAEYSLGETFTDLAAVRVGTTPYDRISPDEMWQIENGASYTIRDGFGGLYAPDWSSTGGMKIQIHPVPTTAGDTIQGREVIRVPDPSDWAVSDPATPESFDAAIRHGAIAIGLMMKDENLDQAGWHEQRFLAAIPELRRRKNTRVGSGGVRIRLGNLGR